MSDYITACLFYILGQIRVQCEYIQNGKVLPWKNLCILKIVQSSHVSCILYKVIQILTHKFALKVSRIITTDNSLHTATLKPKKILFQWELIGNKCWLFKQSAALHPTYVCQMTTQTSNRKAHRSKTDAILPHCVGDKKTFIVFIALWYNIFRGIRNESQRQSTIT